MKSIYESFFLSVVINAFAVVRFSFTFQACREQDEIEWIIIGLLVSSCLDSVALSVIE